MIKQCWFSEIEKTLSPLGVEVYEHRIGVDDPNCLPTVELRGRIDLITAADTQRNPYIPSRILVSQDGITTVVFWRDGTKTVVKKAIDEEYSPYAAFTAALAIKVCGSNSAVKRIVKGSETQKSKKKRQIDPCVSAFGREN